MADPLFVDPAAGRLPAEARLAGAEGSASGRSITLRAGRRRPSLLPRCPGLSTASRSSARTHNYENTPAGLKANGPATSEEASAGSIRVTDQLAASGHQSLLFSNTPGLKHRYNPHIHYDTRFSSGMLDENFSLFWKPGAVFYHEWRDTAQPYHVGPSLRVEADGTLSASGRKLGQIPAETWVRIDLSCVLGQAANGQYDLTVHFPDDSNTIHQQGLPSAPLGSASSAGLDSSPMPTDQPPSPSTTLISDPASPRPGRLIQLEGQGTSCASVVSCVKSPKTNQRTQLTSVDSRSAPPCDSDPESPSAPSLPRADPRTRSSARSGPPTGYRVHPVDHAAS